MLEDTFEDMNALDEGLDEEADIEVDKVLSEVTGGMLGTAGHLPEMPQVEEESAETIEGDKQFLDGMKQKLELLKS